MIDAIEEQFAAAGRTPKGRRALCAIFRATRETVAKVGLEAASLDLIALRAGLTQASLRHYFPTRDDLLTRFFTAGTEWLRKQFADMIRADEPNASRRMERCIGWHLEYMEHVDTTFWLEASAFWLRRHPARRTRDNWYQWLTGQYAAMIGEIRPSLNAAERQRRAWLVLTLILGAWITHGRGSTVAGTGRVAQRRQQLVAAAMDIATAR